MASSSNVEPPRPPTPVEELVEHHPSTAESRPWSPTSTRCSIDITLIREGIFGAESQVHAKKRYDERQSKALTLDPDIFSDEGASQYANLDHTLDYNMDNVRLPSKQIDEETGIDIDRKAFEHIQISTNPANEPPPINLTNWPIPSEPPSAFSSAMTTQRSTPASIYFQKYNKHKTALKELTLGDVLHHSFIKSVYRRIFIVVSLINLAVFIGLLKSHNGNFKPTLMSLVTASAANLLLGVSIRQEYVVNIIFMCVCWVPNTWPMWIRRRLAKVYHYGGLHSGCNVAAICWFIIFAAYLGKNYVQDGHHELAGVFILTIILLCLLISIAFSAHPTFRQKYHNQFEWIHRFAGWTALALFWAQVVVAGHALRRPGISLGLTLAETPAFWLITLATLSIILPWLRLRKVTVRAETLSTHAMRLHFNHTAVGLCQGVRITHSPLKEWHAFATIAGVEYPEGSKDKWSLIISNAGDWTKHNIANPPEKVWIRGIPVYGVLRVVPLFRRALVVATGSGIGPCLSFLLSHPTPCKVLWSARSPETTYGKEIIDLVKRADNEAVIIDTKKSGHPDMVALTLQLYEEFDAEGIFVISNPTVTYMLVGEMEGRGLPAYGPIWDS